MNKKRLLCLLLIFICCLFLQTVSAHDINNLTDIGDDSLISADDESSDVLGDSNDVYFDASQDSQGDGSKENPYKYLTARRLSNNCIAHFAPGEYRLDSLKSIYSNIELIGEDAQNTIIKYKGMAFTVGVGYSLTASGLTFKNASIRNTGTLDFTDCIFDGCRAAYVDDYGNSFGGAIYCKIGGYATTYSPGAYLTNCTFINNYAAYGGAVYIEGGVLDIESSAFKNNHASGYGGAIAGEEGSTVTVSNSLFRNDVSTGDAGGAIYTKISSLNIRNTDFIACSALFGGAVCNLYGQISVSSSNFKNNTAKYDGGAVYGMYGRLSILNGDFTDNTASNGGAVFMDNCSIVTISNSNFNSNNALKGEAVFSNAVTRITNTSNTYTDNDVYFQDNYQTHITGNGNYIITANYTDFDGDLPSYYNLFDEGLLTPVKDQQSGGNCWGFSTIAALESAILKANNMTFDFSEENLKNLAELYSAYGWQMDTNQGGYDEMSIGYLASWLGPVLDINDTYDDYSTLSPVLDSIVHIQNIFYVPARSNYTDNDIIKQYILKYGAVSASYYHSSSYYNPQTFGYYYPGIGNGNHAITIIGWDDNYSKDNFYYTPAGDGAFIIKNSWNETWGDDGFFYISYYDGILYAVGDSQACYGFILNDSMNYTKNYQYDFAGLTDYFITGRQTMWYANEFNATDSENLAAFSTYFNLDTDYVAEIYVNDDLKLTQNGTSHAGYYTIPLKQLISVNIGDTFRISLKITSERYAYIPISEAVSSNRVYFKPGVSYLSFNGRTWYDFYNYEFKYSSHSYTSQVACIKAFTIARDNVNTTITVEDVKYFVGDVITLKALVSDSNGNIINYGYVNFTVDGNNYSVNVLNGLANLTLKLNQSGDYLVVADYFADVGFNPSNTTANIKIAKLPLPLSLNISDIVYGDDLVINIETQVSEVNLTVNGKTYLVNAQRFTLPDLLDVGQYTAIVTFNGSDKYLSNSTSFKFSVDKKTIEINTTVDEDLTIQLSEALNTTLTFIMDNKTTLINTVNGVAYVNIGNLTHGNHTYNVLFSDKNYNNVTDSGAVEITDFKVNIIASDIVKYYGDSQRFVIRLLDDNNNPITDFNFTVTLNGVTYSKNTNVNGTASVSLNLNSGVYNVSVVVNATGDYLSNNSNYTVSILPTVEAYDLVKIYRNQSQYAATFKDFEGNLVKNTEVQFNINGIYYTRNTNALGVAHLNINLGQGEYVITAINPISGEMHTNNIKVLSRIVENNDLVKYYRNASQFKVRIIGDDGEFAKAGENVSFNINGMIYTRTTNSQGHVNLNINLGPGEYTITTDYKGCMESNKIKVLSVLSANDMTMSYRDGSRFEARLLNGQGDPYYLRNITFNINGMIYERTTDVDGIARLNINLMNGEYIITTSYNGENTANKITIT